MNSDEEKIIELLRRLPNRANDRADRANCPDEEALAIFLGGHLLENRRKEVETHLAKCSFCLEDLVAAYRSGQDYNMQRVPQQLMDKAMGLVEGKETLFDLAVRLVRDSIELISTSGRVASAPVPAAIRRGPKLSEGSILQLEKEVGRFNVAVELELVEAGMCQVVVSVKDEGGRPAEGIRLSLVSGGREQASFLTRRGVVVFDRIPPGEYSISLSDSGTPVGTIRLRTS
jgi:hypothetical protein